MPTGLSRKAREATVQCLSDMKQSQFERQELENRYSIERQRVERELVHRDGAAIALANGAEVRELVEVEKAQASNEAHFRKLSEYSGVSFAQRPKSFSRAASSRRTGASAFSDAYSFRSRGSHAGMSNQGEQDEASQNEAANKSNEEDSEAEDIESKTVFSACSSKRFLARPSSGFMNLGSRGRRAGISRTNTLRAPTPDSEDDSDSGCSSEEDGDGPAVLKASGTKWFEVDLVQRGAEREDEDLEARRRERARIQASEAARAHLRRTSVSGSMPAAINSVRPGGGRSKARRESLNTEAPLQHKLLARLEQRYSDPLLNSSPDSPRGTAAHGSSPLAITTRSSGQMLLSMSGSLLDGIPEEMHEAKERQLRVSFSGTAPSSVSERASVQLGRHKSYSVPGPAHERDTSGQHYSVSPLSTSSNPLADASTQLATDVGVMSVRKMRRPSAGSLSQGSPSWLVSSQELPTHHSMPDSPTIADHQDHTRGSSTTLRTVPKATPASAGAAAHGTPANDTKTVTHAQTHTASTGSNASATNTGNAPSIGVGVGAARGGDAPVDGAEGPSFGTGYVAPEQSAGIMVGSGRLDTGAGMGPASSAAEGNETPPGGQPFRSSTQLELPQRRADGNPDQHLPAHWDLPASSLAQASIIEPSSSTSQGLAMASNPQIGVLSGLLSHDSKSQVGKQLGLSGATFSALAPTQTGSSNEAKGPPLAASISGGGVEVNLSKEVVQRAPLLHQNTRAVASSKARFWSTQYTTGPSRSRGPSLDSFRPSSNLARVAPPPPQQEPLQPHPPASVPPGKGGPITIQSSRSQQPRASNGSASSRAGSFEVNLSQRSSFGSGTQQERCSSSRARSLSNKSHSSINLQHHMQTRLSIESQPPLPSALSGSRSTTSTRSPSKLRRGNEGGKAAQKASSSQPAGYLNLKATLGSAIASVLNPLQTKK